MKKSKVAKKFESGKTVKLSEAEYAVATAFSEEFFEEAYKHLTLKKENYMEMPPVTLEGYVYEDGAEVTEARQSDKTVLKVSSRYQKTALFFAAEKIAVYSLTKSLKDEYMREIYAEFPYEEVAALATKREKFRYERNEKFSYADYGVFELTAGRTFTFAFGAMPDKLSDDARLNEMVKFIDNKKRRSF